MIEYNLNESVYVRLNNIGRNIYKNHMQSLYINLSTEPEVDENDIQNFNSGI